MRQLQERILEQADRQAHFRPQRSQFHIIKIREVWPDTPQIVSGWN
jgi:hypothetical protein